jgi:uncharacterized membrane protein YpjA
LVWRWLLSKDVLLHPFTLALMMLIYVPGTIYGYYWYKHQLFETWQENPHWQIPFVPDSPTASLLFAVAMAWLWISPQRSHRTWVNSIRSIIEALGVVTSVKYGVWATVILFVYQAQGGMLTLLDWMLIIGHTAMAVTALVYARFFRYGVLALLAAAAWTFLNDTLDYSQAIFPYLPFQLLDDLFAVAVFTFCLTGASVLSAAFGRYWRRSAMVSD